MEKQTHILFISSWYPNRNNPTHGIFNKEFAKAAALYNKVSVLHICSDENMSSGTEWVESEENNIYTLIVYYKKIKSASPFVDLLLKRRKVLQLANLGFSKLISKAGKPDLIQLNVVMPMGIAALHLSKKHNIPFVVNEAWSGYLPQDGNYKGFFQTYFTKKIISKAKIIMPVSKDLMKAMQHHGLQGNYVVVPNVVDVNLFVPKEKKVSDNTTKFYHVSSLDDAQKNVSGIIRAFANALKIKPNMELTIIGEGENRHTLEKLVKELNAANQIKFAGRLMGQDLVNAINEHDALIMFSNYETFSLTTAEAWACGKFVISSKAGGITNEVPPKIAHKLCAMVERKNEEQLTEAILNFDKEKSKYDNTFSRQFVMENFTKAEIGVELTHIYYSMLK
ncbi:MAG: glycosyltransferase [Bacteroidetes bacterium]|nr:glycosyltransferase [Bacteroidota bacterium]